MTVGDWLANLRRRARERGRREAAVRAAVEAGKGAGQRLGQRWTYGRLVWDRDWDVLIILDACRADLFDEVAAERDWIGSEREVVYSRASMSREWLERHSAPLYRRETLRTALISANPYVELSDAIDQANWGHVDPLIDHAWDDEAGIVPPAPVTDAAIRYWRDETRRRRHGVDQMIVWYMQPHNPFLGADWSRGYERSTLNNPDKHADTVWKRLRRGELRRERVWQAYRENLELVVDEVDRLRQNLAADRAVITSDHANCIGEWGVYGHPPYLPLPNLKRVPWAPIEAHDARTSEPGAIDRSETANSATDRLEALGYA